MFKKIPKSAIREILLLQKKTEKYEIVVFYGFYTILNINIMVLEMRFILQKRA